MISPLHLATLALAVGSAAAATAGTIASEIKGITKLTRNAFTEARAINTLSGAQYLVGAGPYPVLLEAFKNIGNDVQAYTSAAQSTPKLNTAGQDEVYNAFKAFVTQQQTLIGTVGGKAALLNNLPVLGPPVQNALTTLQNLLDAYVNALVAISPGQRSNYNTQVTLLNDAYTTAIGDYGSSTGSTGSGGSGGIPPLPITLNKEDGKVAKRSYPIVV